MEILIVILCIIIAFISSGFEAGYLKLEKEPNFKKDNIFISTTLFVNTLAINFGAIFFAIFLDRFEIQKNLKSLFEISIYTTIILIIAETIPKSIAFYYPSFFYNPLLRTIYWNISFLFIPVFKILNLVFRPYNYISERILTIRDILLPLKLIIEKEFWREQKALIIQEFISFIKSPIKHFLKPSIEVELVSYNSKVRDVINLFKSKNYRFYPVYKNSFNDIVGVIDVSDLISVNEDEHISKYIKEPLVLFDSYPAFEFLRNNYDFGIVYDEFGNFEGIITRKEILRNIFNIYKPNIRKISQRVYIIDDPIDLGLIEELTGVHLGEPNKNINEFFMERNIENLDEGKEYVFENIKITILNKKGNYISRIKLEF